MHLREIAFLVRRTQTARPFPVFWYDLSSDAREKKRKKEKEKEKRERFLNLVHLEKCRKMSIWLQKSASVQPRTSLSKFGVMYSVIQIHP